MCVCDTKHVHDYVGELESHYHKQSSGLEALHINMSKHAVVYAGFGIPGLCSSPLHSSVWMCNYLKFLVQRYDVRQV